jgi:hypothetical protein
MWWLFILWLIQPGTIIAGTPLTVTLTAGAGPADAVYIAAPDEVLTVTARSAADEPVDVTLEILRDNQRIAFNDDHHTEFSDLAPLDAAITGLHIKEAGVYTLRIHSFSGAQSGEVEVLVQSEPLIQPCETPAQTVELPPNRAFACLLDLQAGQTLTLTARDISGTLDPVLTLLDPDGAQMVINDDHDSSDLTLNVLDAKMVNIPIDEAGTYTVLLSDFGGAAGTLALGVEIES